jgi:uncharacterized protein (DUF1778 family)
MKSSKKAPNSVRNIRFKDAAQIELIKRAALRHGISVNAFIVRIAVRAAERALELEADPLTNVLMSAPAVVLAAASSTTEAQLKETAA